MNSPFGPRTPAQYALLNAGWDKLSEPERSLLWAVAARTAKSDWYWHTFPDEIARAVRTLTTWERNIDPGRHFVAREPASAGQGHLWQVEPYRCQYDSCGKMFERQSPGHKFCTSAHRKAQRKLEREFYGDQK